jgi:hypothetical protein
MRWRFPGPQLPAHRQATGQVCLGTSGEGSNLLMSDMQPFDLPLATYSVGNAVEAVAHDAVDALDTCDREGLGEQVCDCVHVVSPGSIN